MGEFNDGNKDAFDWAEESINRVLGKGRRFSAKQSEPSIEMHIEETSDVKPADEKQEPQNILTVEETGVEQIIAIELEPNLAPQIYIFNEDNMTTEKGIEKRVVKKRALNIADEDRQSIIEARLNNKMSAEQLSEIYPLTERQIKTLVAEYKRRGGLKARKEKEPVKRSTRTTRNVSKNTKSRIKETDPKSHDFEIEEMYDLNNPVELEALLDSLNPQEYKRFNKGGKNVIVKLKSAALGLAVGFGTLFNTAVTERNVELDSINPVASISQNSRVDGLNIGRFNEQTTSIKDRVKL